MSKKLSTSEIADLFDVSVVTVCNWCNQNLFPNAGKRGGDVWEIPESDLKDFQPPKRGRRRDPNPSDFARAKRLARARGEQLKAA